MTDIEHSRCALRYVYSFEQNGSPSSQYLLLSIYSPFWIVNRTPDLLLFFFLPSFLTCSLSGKSKTSPVVRLPGASIKMGFEGAVSMEDMQSLSPVLYSEDEKKVVIRIRRDNSDWSDKTKVSEGSSVVKVPAQLPFMPMETFYTIVVRRLNAPFIHTKLLTILPRYMFINRTGFDMAVYQNSELLSLPRHSCACVSSLLPAPRHLLSFSILGSSTPLSSPCVAKEVKSAQFDVDAVGQWDVLLSESNQMDVLSNHSSLFSLTAAEVNGQQTITVERLKPENVSICVSNNSALDMVQVLQMSSDLSYALPVAPLDSQFYVLPHPAGPQMVVLFLQQIDSPPSEETFVPCVVVDLTNLGKVTTVQRENPSRTLEVTVEVEDTTRIIIIREKLEQDEWKQRKQLEYTRVVLEDSITQIQFNHDALKTEVSDFISALTDFEEYAMKPIYTPTPESPSDPPQQPVFMTAKNSRATMDLLLNDEYYWLNVRNVSIRNLQRKPCTITTRISNGETMLETKPKRGSHVFVDEEIIMRRHSSVLQVKVSVAFEKSVVEFNTFVEYDMAEEYNTMKVVPVPFKEENPLCNGGCLYLYLVHCKNNKINNDQMDYLPHLLKSLYDSEKELSLLKESRNCLDFELYLNSSMHSALLGHPLLRSLQQSKDDLSTRVSNIHIQRALRRGFYQDFRSGKTIEEVLQPSSSNEPIEMEQEQSLVVELRQFANVPSLSRSLIAQIRCGDQVFRCGEMGASSAPSTLASAQQAKIFKEVKIGCKMCLNEAGQILVTSVEKGSEADRLGVLVGMSLWGVNDGSVEGLIPVNRKLKTMARPLKLVFLAPYRRVLS